MRRKTRIVAALTVLLLAGCNNVSKMGVLYNTGLADGFNSLILVNVVRSAKGYPTYYSAIGDFTGTDKQTADILPEFILGGSSALDAQPELIFEREKAVSVSSLETQDFTVSMHSRITSKILEALVESRDRNHLNLAFMLLVERVAIRESDYLEIKDAIYRVCSTDFDLLSSSAQGICAFFRRESNNLSCYGYDVAGGPGGGRFNVITLVNDPTNACRYHLFRIFAEMLALQDPYVRVDNNGHMTMRLERLHSKKVLFTDPRTGLVLRSPHQVIAYLGQVVSEQLSGGGEYLKLTDPRGNDIPLFLVEVGQSNKQAPITAKLFGTTYSVPDSGFGGGKAHFTTRSIAIVKDIITLNTTQTQLPTYPNVYIGGTLD